MIRLGFIGVGFVAQQCHLPAFDSIPGCEIIAVSDLQLDLAQKIGARYEVAKIYKNHEELLQDPDIDAVVITVPRSLTVGLCMQALMQKKKVFVEKPLALNDDSAQQILELAKANNLLVQVGYMRRFDAAVINAYEKIEKYKLEGISPILIRAYSYAGDSYASPFGDFKSKQIIEAPITGIECLPKWLPKEKQIAYENYLNIFSHTLDLLMLFAGEKLIPRDSILDNLGQGVTLFQSSHGTPIELSTARSSLSQWVEGISFVYSDRIIDLELAPAFLKNVPGIVSIREGKNEDILCTNRPKWSWAFKNQAEYFIRQCEKWPNGNSNLAQAAAQVSIIKNLFEKFHV